MLLRVFHPVLCKVNGSPIEGMSSDLSKDTGTFLEGTSTTSTLGTGSAIEGMSLSFGQSTAADGLTNTSYDTSAF